MPESWEPLPSSRGTIGNVVIVVTRNRAASFCACRPSRWPLDSALVSDETHGSRGWRRGFWSLIITQFQGAFSDNALKQLAILLGISIGLSQMKPDRLLSLATGLLALAVTPF